MPIAVIRLHRPVARRATAACVVLRSFDSSSSMEERTVEVRTPTTDLDLLRSALKRLSTEVQVVVLDQYVWLDGTTRPGMGALLYQALDESVSVMGVAEEPCEDGNPEALGIARGHSARPLFVTSVGFPPPVVGKLVRAMHGRGRIPWALSRAAKLARGQAVPRGLDAELVPRPHRIRLPAFARVDRSLPPGDHAYLALLPKAATSPALQRIAPDPEARQRLLEHAVVQIRGQRGYAFVDVEAPCIVVSQKYYAEGGPLDLYLDLLHELTHLRQLTEGFDLWDDRFEYVDRPTEVEGYAVAIEEGRRLGMNEQDVFQHLSNPWMTEVEVRRLIRHIDTFLGGGELPNLALARQAARRKTWRPW